MPPKRRRENLSGNEYPRLALSQAESPPHDKDDEKLSVKNSLPELIAPLPVKDKQIILEMFAGLNKQLQQANEQNEKLKTENTELQLIINAAETEIEHLKKTKAVRVADLVEKIGMMARPAVKSGVKKGAGVTQQMAVPRNMKS